MRDAAVGAGGTVAVGVGLVGLALGATAAARAPWRVVLGLAIASEVSAKLAMATLATAGTASHEGLGSQFTGASAGDLLVAGLLAAPAGLLAWSTLAAVPAVLAGPVVALGLSVWANRRLGGISGDVFGAANELGRVAALHAGVIAWTLS